MWCKNNLFGAVYATQTQQTNVPSLSWIGTCDRDIQTIRTYASDYTEARTGR